MVEGRKINGRLTACQFIREPFSRSKLEVIHYVLLPGLQTLYPPRFQNLSYSRVVVDVTLYRTNGDIELTKNMLSLL
jgi:hypothetical protein